MSDKKTSTNIITEDSFTIDDMGRIVIIDNKELLDMISGGLGTGIDEEVAEEVTADFFEPLLFDDPVNGNCGCTGSGSGSGTGSGSGRSGSRSGRSGSGRSGMGRAHIHRW